MDSVINPGNATARTRVLHIINIGGYGGGEKLLLQLLPALNEHITADCLIFHNENNPQAALQIAKDLQDRNISVEIFSYKKVISPSIFRKIRLKTKEGGYDLIHSHLKQADFWLAILKRTKRISIPVVSTMHGYNDAYENKNGFTLKPELYRSPYYQVTRLIYRQFEGFVLISKIVRDFFNKSGLIGKGLQQIIPHGYQAQEAIAEVAPKADPGAKISIAVPGRMIKRKGHGYAIDAIKLLKAHYPEITLHFFGAGPEWDNLQLKVKSQDLEDTVIFHGYVHSLLAELRKMDIVWIPSLFEGFGLVFLDSFAVGVPAVAFDLPAANEIIQHGRNGLLVEPRSAEKLAAATQSLLADPALRTRLATQGLEDLHSIYSMKKMTNAYIGFYQSILQGKK